MTALWRRPFPSYHPHMLDTHFLGDAVGSRGWGLVGLGGLPLHTTPTASAGAGTFLLGKGTGVGGSRSGGSANISSCVGVC